MRYSRKSNLQSNAASERLLAELNAAAERLLTGRGLTKDDIHMKGFYSYDRVTGENIAAKLKRAAKRRNQRI